MPPVSTSVSPNAVIAPLMPSTSIATTARSSVHPTAPCWRKRSGWPPCPHHAVSVSAASSKKVLTR